MLQIRYGGVTFSSRPLPGALVVPILAGGLQGWEERPAARSHDSDRPGGHGSFDAPVLLSSRLVTVSAHLDGADRQISRVLAGLPLRGRFTVSEFGESQWSDAQLVESSPRRQQLRRHGVADLVFRFPNPRKFGEQRVFTSTGSSVPAFHYGNFDADPVFEVSGFVNGYRITGPGGDFTVSGPRPSGAVDVVDFSTGLLTRDGVPLTRAVTSAKLWTVGPGERVSWRVQPVRSGSGSARLLLTDTFI